MTLKVSIFSLSIGALLMLSVMTITMTTTNAYAQPHQQQQQRQQPEQSRACPIEDFELNRGMCEAEPVRLSPNCDNPPFPIHGEVEAEVDENGEYTVCIGIDEDGNEIRWEPTPVAFVCRQGSTMNEDTGLCEARPGTPQETRER